MRAQNLSKIVYNLKIVTYYLVDAINFKLCLINFVVVLTHLKIVENLENENLNFQAWKSPGNKRETGKCPGKILEIFE